MLLMDAAVRDSLRAQVDEAARRLVAVDCPIEAVVAPAGAWTLNGLSCSRCGEPLAEHTVTCSDIVPPGRAYEIDRSAFPSDA